MKQPDTLKYLGAYASGTLSPAEERKLYEAALDDQELFNAVADEELLREALADPAFRQRLIRRLREMDREPASGISAVIANWFRRPADWLRQPPALAAACLAAITLIVGVRFMPEDYSPTGTPAAVTPGEQLFAKKGLRPTSNLTPATTSGREDPLETLWERARTGRYEGFELGLDRSGEVPQYGVGEGIRIRFLVPRDSTVVILANDPDGVVTQLFPNEWNSSPQIGANEEIWMPREERQYSLAADAPGRYQLRMLVFEAGTDPLESGVSGQGRPLALERSFEVSEEAGERIAPSSDAGSLR